MHKNTRQKQKDVLLLHQSIFLWGFNMRYEDIVKSVQELIKLYKAGEDGRNSDRAKEICELLAKEKWNDVSKATLKARMTSGVLPKDLISSMTADIEAVRPKENAAITPKKPVQKPTSNESPQQEPQPKKEPSQPQPQTERESFKPKPKKGDRKNTPSALGKGQQATLATLAEYASETGIDLTTVTRDNYRDIVDKLEAVQEKAIAKDLHDYLTGKTDDYSDRVADYLESNGLSPSKQRYHWNKMLSILRSEFTTRPQNKEDKINRKTLMDMALNVYQSSKRKSAENPQVPEPKIAERTETLLSQMSRVSRSDYQKRLQHHKGRDFPKDQFLLDIKANSRNDSDLIPLTDKIAAAHVQEMLGLLEPAAQDKYIASLRKNELENYVPEGYTPHTKEDNSLENRAFKPTGIQKKACGLAGLNWKDYKDADSLTTALQSAGFVIEGRNIIDLNTNGDAPRGNTQEQDTHQQNGANPHKKGDRTMAEENKEELKKALEEIMDVSHYEQNGVLEDTLETQPDVKEEYDRQADNIKKLQEADPQTIAELKEELKQQYPNISDDTWSMVDDKTKKPEEAPTPPEEKVEETEEHKEEEPQVYEPLTEEGRAELKQALDEARQVMHYKVNGAEDQLETDPELIELNKRLNSNIDKIKEADPKVVDELKHEIEDDYAKKNVEISQDVWNALDEEIKKPVLNFHVKEDEEVKQPTNEEEHPEEHPTPTPATGNEIDNDDWIARKAAYYKDLSEKNQIANYERDETVQNGFAASFNEAKIHYESPNNVAVSKEAGLNVFDAMLKEPDNQGRRVNFSADMPPEMAARLYAACLINGNEMGGSVPQLTEEQLRAALGDEYAVFQQKMAERAAERQDAQPTTEQPTTEQPTQEGAEPKPNEGASQEGTEPQPTKEEIKQAMRDQYDMAQMEMAGKVSKAKEPRLPDAPAYVRGANCSDEEFEKYKTMQERAEANKEMLFEQYKKDPEAFRATMNEVVQEAQISKIDALRTRVHLNQTREETPEEKTARLKENVKATQAALGIIPEYTDTNGVKHQKLEGEALDKFVADKKISAYTYGNLGGKDAAFAEKLPPAKEGGDAKKDFANGQAAHTARTTNSNTGRS